VNLLSQPVSVKIDNPLDGSARSWVFSGASDCIYLMELSMSEVRVRFEKDLAEVDWRSLRIHTQRDALILVDLHLDLIDVAIKVTDDAVEQVSDWVEKGFLIKPTAEQLSCWETVLDKPFVMLIAAPYILFQEVQHA